MCAHDVIRIGRYIGRSRTARIINWPIYRPVACNVLITFVGMSAIVGDYSTHLRRSGITVWLGLIFVGISALKGLKLTCMNESDPVLLMP